MKDFSIQPFLLFSIVQREYSINKDNKRHLSTHGYDGKSSSFNFDFTFDEQRLIRMPNCR